MTVYSSLEVYPRSFDEVDQTQCQNCDFECGTIGYCLKDCGEAYIISKLLQDKGYGQVNIDWAIVDEVLEEGLELYKNEAKKFMANMEKLGYFCIEYHHPLQKKYLNTIVIVGKRPIDLCLDFLKLDVIR